jgi:sugar phosphate isomerase/epimerase
MKIGTTTLPLAGWLVDPRKPEEGRQQRLATIRHIVEGYGLSAVELTLDLAMVFPQVFGASYYSAVADLQQEIGITCTVHLPFLWVDPASLNEPVRQASSQCLRRSIELTRPVEVSTYVVHLWGLATTQIMMLLEHAALRQGVLAGMMAQAGRSLAEVCELLDPRDLCVENLEAPPFDAALPLIEQNGVSICLDVGHLAWEGDNALEFLARHGDLVREVHLHDALSIPAGPRPQIRDHLPLGQGDIDYLALLNRLQEVDFQGTVILENNSQAELEASLEQLGDFL